MADAPRRPPSFGAAVAAAQQKARRSLLRNHNGGHAPVSMLELFFDLVYVFAITQLSHFLHHHLGWLGLLEGVMLFLALWWAWMYTTWATNWANPDRLPVRLMLLAMMLLSLLMAIWLPGAFEDSSLAFALAYVALQVGRSTFMAALFRREAHANALNMLRIALWFMATAPLWIVGGIAGGSAQIGLWLAALAIEYAGPFAFFRVPFLGRSTLANWDISGSHMAERCGLFIIIALGEGIVVTGSAFADGDMATGRLAAMLFAFLGSVLMWWIYFDIGAQRGARMISEQSLPGRLARNAYTYVHMPIVLGIVIAAIADALVLEHWNEPADRPLVLVLCGGLLLFLLGVGLFKRFHNPFGNLPLSHSFGILLLLVLGVYGWFSPPNSVTFVALSCAVLAVTAVWEWVSYNGGWIEKMEARGWSIGTRLRERAERRQQRLKRG